MKIPATAPDAFDAAVMGLAAYLGLRAFDVPILYAEPVSWLCMAVVLVWRWLKRRKAARRSFNCASCGQHHPTPSVIVTLGGTFAAEDATHAGVCVAWCKACAAEDALHAATLRHVHNNNVPELMVVLAALAHRGPGRVNWMSQDTLDRMRKINNMPVHPVTSERTVH